MKNQKRIFWDTTSYPIEYPEEIRKIYFKVSLTSRIIFTKWIGNISKNFNNDIDWWITLPLSRNPYLSNLFHYTCVLRTLKNEGYISEFEHVDDKRGGKFKIKLLAKITKCGAITPRFKVKKDEYNTWEQQFLPSYNRGMLLVTTNQGVMSHKDAANKGLGGFLIGYVY